MNQRKILIQLKALYKTMPTTKKALRKSLHEKKLHANQKPIQTLKQQKIRQRRWWKYAKKVNDENPTHLKLN